MQVNDLFGGGPVPGIAGAWLSAVRWDTAVGQVSELVPLPGDPYVDLLVALNDDKTQFAPGPPASDCVARALNLTTVGHRVRHATHCRLHTS